MYNQLLCAEANKISQEIILFDLKSRFFKHRVKSKNREETSSKHGAISIETIENHRTTMEKYRKI